MDAGVLLALCFPTSGEERPTFRVVPPHQLSSLGSPEMFLTSPPGILDPGMLISNDHHKEAEATD